MFKDKLPIEQQQEIVNSLFGFNFVDIDENPEKPHYVLFDEEGFEFYAYKKNLNFDFSNLEGIFAYAVNRAKEQGYSDFRNQMRKLLDI